MLKVFQGERHADFLIECGVPAALLIHGFPGTPAEMRPLAAILNAHGWTTRGLLLPGFGAQIASLWQRQAQEWIDAAVETLRSMQEHHQPVILLGYSMGAAVAIHAATRLRIDRLVLLAPFWRLGTRHSAAPTSTIRACAPFLASSCKIPIWTHPKCSSWFAAPEFLSISLIKSRR
jgi:esterase/lipase